MISLSSLATDRTQKGSLYARAGLADYWVLNLVDRVLEVYRESVADAAAPFGWSYAHSAKALLAAGRFDGATYLCGYAVEVSLEERICRVLTQDHFGLWNAVAVWKAESRYNVAGTAQQVDTTAMIQAAERLLAVL